MTSDLFAENAGIFWGNYPGKVPFGGVEPEAKNYEPVLFFASDGKQKKGLSQP